MEPQTAFGQEGFRTGREGESNHPLSHESAIDPNLPVRLLPSCPPPGSASLSFCVREAAARDHQDPARSCRSRQAA
jgi:hypothetical protein